MRIPQAFHKPWERKPERQPGPTWGPQRCAAFRGPRPASSLRARGRPERTRSQRPPSPSLIPEDVGLRQLPEGEALVKNPDRGIRVRKEAGAVIRGRCHGHRGDSASSRSEGAANSDRSRWLPRTSPAQCPHQRSAGDCRGPRGLRISVTTQCHRGQGQKTSRHLFTVLNAYLTDKKNCCRGCLMPVEDAQLSSSSPFPSFTAGDRQRRRRCGGSQSHHYAFIQKKLPPLK